MAKQILVIHGGSTFETYDEYIESLKTKEVSLEKLARKDWKRSLHTELGEEYQVITPQMPNGWNARYLEWEIWFSKISTLVNDDVILIGHSLGGIFLAKYLSENPFSKKIKATFLVAAPFGPDLGESLTDFVLPKDLSRFEKQSGRIFLYQSEDDPVVPVHHVHDYAKHLPHAELRIFKDRKHFNVESMPELVEDIKSLN